MDKLSLNGNILQHLDKATEFDFNIFQFAKACEGSELVTLTTYLMNKHRLFEKLSIDIDIFIAYFKHIQDNYKPIPYHNKTHGADVAQTLYYFAVGCGFDEIGKTTEVDLAAMIIGAGCHDYEHPGFNNQFLVETRSELATRYNDNTVLENHHAASSYAVAQ